MFPSPPKLLNALTSYGVPLLFALLLHALVIALISMNWGESTVSYDDIKPYYIDAQVVKENPYTAREKRAQDAEISRRDRRLQQRREDERKFQRQLKEWDAEDRKRAEAARNLREARQQAPVPSQSTSQVNEPASAETTPIDQEAVRSEFEAGLTQALIEELNLRKAVTDDEKAMAYVAQIQREIIQNWSRPPSARNGMEALLRVRLFPTGELMDVKLEDSSGNDAFDRSAVQAVRKAGRFMVPDNTRLFERSFREFTLLFRPDDLRL